MEKTGFSSRGGWAQGNGIRQPGRRTMHRGRPIAIVGFAAPTPRHRAATAECQQRRQGHDREESTHLTRLFWRATDFQFVVCSRVSLKREQNGGWPFASRVGNVAMAGKAPAVRWQALVVDAIFVLTLFFCGRLGFHVTAVGTHD